jgi:hypothetical protein
MVGSRWVSTPMIFVPARASSTKRIELSRPTANGRSEWGKTTVFLSGKIAKISGNWVFSGSASSKPAGVIIREFYFHPEELCQASLAEAVSV